MKRRILTLLLTLVMVLSLLPGTALAVNDSSAPAVTYADLADINGTALVPDGAGENTELTVADAVRALLLWTGMTEQQLGSFPDDYLAQARSMGMIDTDTDADAPCTLAAYRQMKAVADQMYDALHADKLQPLYMNGMAQPIFPYTTGEVTEGYSNDESDIIRYCVYVETNYDTDDDGKLDLVKALVQIPRAAMEGNYKAATIYEARPYITGCNESMNPGKNLGSESYDISKLYSQPDKRVPAGTATTADAAAAADSADWYYWNPYEQMYDYEDLNWYDYYLVRGFAVVECGGLGTKGSDGFETCGTDLEIDAFKCVIEWLHGDRVAYTDKTSNVAISADWSSGKIGMTGRSYAGTTLPFTDVAEDAYYTDAVKWAAANGVTAGTSATTFSPNDTCTRAQAVTLLYNAAGAPAVSDTVSFADVAADAYYADAVAWAAANGVTVGTSATTFSPDDACTRGQIVCMLYRGDTQA